MVAVSIHTGFVPTVRSLPLCRYLGKNGHYICRRVYKEKAVSLIDCSIIVNKAGGFQTLEKEKVICSSLLGGREQITPQFNVYFTRLAFYIQEIYEIY